MKKFEIGKVYGENSVKEDYMKKRIYALTTVGKTLGIERMLALVKPEEKEELHRYVRRRFFLNTYGVSQEMEMAALKYQQEGAALGWEYLRALMEI